MPLSPSIPPRPLDHWSFISLLADILRLPEETVVLTHLYINTYLYYCPHLTLSIDLRQSQGQKQQQEKQDHKQQYQQRQQHQGQPLGPRSKGKGSSQNYQLGSDYGTGPGSSSSLSSASSESESSAYGVKLATERENDATREGEIDGIRACEGVTASKKVLPLVMMEDGDTDTTVAYDAKSDRAGDVQMDEGADVTGKDIGERQRAYEAESTSTSTAAGSSFEEHNLITGLDIFTLSLATLALAAKSTESPRRLSSLLPPSYQLLQRRRLYVPSQEYDILRATLVRAKLLVLRVLRFELRRDSPLAWIEPFSRRVLEGDDEPLGEGPDWNAERRGEEGIVAYGMAGGGLVRRARARSVDACKDSRIANYYPSYVIAAACVWVTMQERGYETPPNLTAWVDVISKGRVNVTMFTEVVDLLIGSNAQVQ